MFPVGLLTEAGLSTPVLKDGRFIGWYDGWIGGRKFPVDMAGFAVSVPFLLTVSDERWEGVLEKGPRGGKYSPCTLKNGGGCCVDVHLNCDVRTLARR